MFVGDLIFEGSIGRTDLPLCTYPTPVSAPTPTPM